MRPNYAYNFLALHILYGVLDSLNIQFKICEILNYYNAHCKFKFSKIMQKYSEFFRTENQIVFIKLFETFEKYQNNATV